MKNFIFCAVRKAGFFTDPLSLHEGSYNEYIALSYLTYYFPGTHQPAITCSKLTIETLEQGVKYVQS